MSARQLLLISLALGSAALSGCRTLTPPATAVDSSGLSLTANSSARVRVYGPRLQTREGHLELAGQVAKQPGAFTTAFSHLDVRLLDRSGSLLAIRPVGFVPRSIGWSRFGARFAYYAFSLDSIPEGTVQIRVGAHDADIRTAHTAERTTDMLAPSAPPRG